MSSKIDPVQHVRAIFNREAFKDLPDGMTTEEFMVKYREMIDTITKCADDSLNQLVYGQYLEDMSNFLAQDLANKVLKGNLEKKYNITSIKKLEFLKKNKNILECRLDKSPFVKVYWLGHLWSLWKVCDSRSKAWRSLVRPCTWFCNVHGPQTGPKSINN